MLGVEPQRVAADHAERAEQLGDHPAQGQVPAGEQQHAAAVPAGLEHLLEDREARRGQVLGVVHHQQCAVPRRDGSAARRPAGADGCPQVLTVELSAPHPPHARRRPPSGRTRSAQPAGGAERLARARGRHHDRDRGVGRSVQPVPQLARRHVRAGEHRHAVQRLRSLTRRDNSRLPRSRACGYQARSAGVHVPSSVRGHGRPRLGHGPRQVPGPPPPGHPGPVQVHRAAPRRSSEAHEPAPGHDHHASGQWATVSDSEVPGLARFGGGRWRPGAAALRSGREGGGRGSADDPGRLRAA